MITREKSRTVLPSILRIGSLAALAVAFVELIPPAQTVTATLAILAAGAMFLVAEVLS